MKNRSSTKTLIRNAHVLCLDPGLDEYPKGDILIDGDEITAIGPQIDPGVIDDEGGLHVIDASGLLAMPGLINGHFHSSGNFLRGAFPDYPLEIFMLYEVPPLGERPVPPEMHYARTMLSAVEMMKLGVTAVHDDVYYVPTPTEEAIDAVMQAYADSGMRATVTIDQPNVAEYKKFPYLKEILPKELVEAMDEAPLASAEELLGHYHHLIEAWHGREGGRLRAAVSVSAPQRVTPEYFRALSELSRERDLAFDVHVLETRLQCVLGLEKYGKSLIKYMDDLGVLDERMQLIHSIWVNESDLDLVEANGCTVAHNPICNLKLGSGIMPWRRLRDRDIPISLGSDEICTDDTVNMWFVGKTAGLIHNITDRDYSKWPAAVEILRALTTGGAKGMRQEERVGFLKPGAQADLILLDMNTLAFVPLNDLYRQLVFCESGSSVAMTMIAGQIVYENGKVLTVDEEALKEEIRGHMREYRKIREVTLERAKRLEPFYREMYERSLECDVGMIRWADDPLYGSGSTGLLA